MKTIRFEITEETNAALNAIKGNSLKKPFAQELFEKAVMAEYKKLTKKANS